MNEQKEQLQKSMTPDMNKAILSNPAHKDAKYRRIVCEHKNQKFQLACYTEKQVFHENLEFDQLLARVDELLGKEYRQLNVFYEDHGTELRVSKGGKLFARENREKAAKEVSHNRKKHYILEEGEVIPPLVDMGIFTKEGRIVASMQDKYRQINRFVELVDDAVSELATDRPIHIIDFGCGKSYLTFILYYYFTEKKKMQVHITGLDLKETVITNCNLAAEKYGYQNLHFELGDINGYQTTEPVDMVVTLHACDVATDYALFNAVAWKAKLIFSVPCCQHELNGQMKSENLALFTHYGIIKERMAALMTDAVRANLLITEGYRAQVLEFVDLADTPKNLLIRAVRSFQPPSVKAKAMKEVKQAMEAFQVTPKLYSLLENEKKEYS